jgi:hypothetical protein
MDDVDPTVPAHLRPLLGVAAEHELEAATDHEWPADNDARATHRDAVMETAHMVDNWEADALTREEVVRLAERAASDQQPADFIGTWPTSITEADELARRVDLTRDLLQLRDALGGRST